VLDTGAAIELVGSVAGSGAVKTLPGAGGRACLPR